MFAWNLHEVSRVINGEVTRIGDKAGASDINLQWRTLVTKQKKRRSKARCWWKNYGLQEDYQREIWHRIVRLKMVTRLCSEGYPLISDIETRRVSLIKKRTKKGCGLANSTKLSRPLTVVRVLRVCFRQLWSQGWGWVIKKIRAFANKQTLMAKISKIEHPSLNPLPPPPPRPSSTNCYSQWFGNTTKKIFVQWRSFS